MNKLASYNGNPGRDSLQAQEYGLYPGADNIWKIGAHVY